MARRACRLRAGDPGTATIRARLSLTTPRRRAVMRSMRIATALAGVSLLAVAACAGGSNNAGPGPGGLTPPKVDKLAALGAGEGQVNIVSWAGYVEDGTNDKTVDWVTNFQQETGCKVNNKIAPTSDDMVTLMKSGDYDVVSASGDASLRLIYGGDVAPVNTDLVPNYEDIFPGLKLKPWNSVNGVAYGIPHGRGANLLMWRTDKVTPAPTSWARCSTRTRRTRERSPRTTRRSTSRTRRST